MTAALAGAWVVALAFAAAALSMRARVARVADAEHELRGALTAFGLGLERLARTAADGGLALSLEAELERARTALTDLSRRSVDGQRPVPLERLVRSAARAWAPPGAARAVRVDWAAGDVTLSSAPGRVAQVLGNVISNAVEHGDGPVAVRAVEEARGVRVEVTNATHPAPPRVRRVTGRGRGLRIAGRAARAAGGRLVVNTESGRTTAALELPVER